MSAAGLGAPVFQFSPAQSEMKSSEPVVADFNGPRAGIANG